jgi:hypothetical protein
MPTTALAKRENDADFIAAEAKLAHLLKALDRIAKRGPSEGPGERLIDEACATFDWIRRTEPHSLVGAAVKLRTLLHPEVGIEFAFHPDDDPGTLRQVLNVIDRELVSRA